MPAKAKRRWRGWVLVLVVALSPGLGVPAGAGAAEHEQDLVVAHVASYRVLPEEGSVDVEFSYLFENRSSSRGFPGFFESLPSDAVDVSARSGSIDLVVAAGAPADGFVSWLVVFPSELRPGGTREVILSWRLIAPPDPADDLVITPGLVAFDAFAGGTPDAGAVSLVIEAPAGYQALGGREFSVDAEDERIRLVVGGAAPYEIVEVALEAPGALTEAHVVDEPIVTAVGATQNWTAAVTAVVPDLVPELDRWFGPRAAPLQIRQRPAAGRQTGAVGLDSDPPTVMVPVDPTESDLAFALARAWVADVDSGEEWFVDGLAASFSQRVTGSAPPLSGPDRVVAPLVDQVGVEGVRTVIDALRAGTVSYPGPVREDAAMPPSWRRLLDLFENLADADAAALFRAFVVDPEHHDELDLRAAARRDYFALADRAGEWALPPFLRMPMAAWEFTAFRERQGEVSDTIATRDGLMLRAADIDLDFGTIAQAVFEAAETDMASTDEVLLSQADALEAISEARRHVRGDRGLLAWLGLFGEDPDGDLDEIVSQWDAGDFDRATKSAHALSDEMEGAVGRGTLRLVIPAVILALLGFVGRRALVLVRDRMSQVVESLS